jgi:hypothetical protein
VICEKSPSRATAIALVTQPLGRFARRQIVRREQSRLFFPEEKSAPRWQAASSGA